MFKAAPRKILVDKPFYRIDIMANLPLYDDKASAKNLYDNFSFGHFSAGYRIVHS